jgi:tetratricopeptide (TPR) repeat protein
LNFIFLVLYSSAFICEICGEILFCGSILLRSLDMRLGFWVLVVVLAGWNAWWAWDDRPVEDLETIAGWMGSGRRGEAEQALRRRVRRSPHDGAARLLLGRLLAARGDRAGAVDQWRRVPSWWPAKAEALFDEGWTLLDADRPREAEAAWRACLVDDPLHPIPAALVTAAARELVRLKVLEGLRDEARAVLWGMFDRSGSDSRASILVDLLRIDLEPVAPGEAAARLRRFVATTPDDGEARRALARAEQALGHAAEANRQIEACLAARPDDLDAWRDRLAILRDQGDRAGVAACLARLPEAAEGDPRFGMFRGLALELHGDWTGAEAAYRRAVDRPPGDEDDLERLARAQERLGNRAEAARRRAHAERLRTARRELPRAYQDYLAATRALQAGAGGPGLSAAIARLASVLETLGRTREAEAWSQLIPQPHSGLGLESQGSRKSREHDRLATAISSGTAVGSGREFAEGAL